MGSWHYAFFFPGCDRKLTPEGAVEVFANFGLEFDAAVLKAQVVDVEGHLEFGDESKLANPFLDDLTRRLEEGEQLLVECRNTDLFISCCFATRYANPFLMFGWSRRLFASLDEAVQGHYWRVLRKAAHQCNAAYVIVVDDPPDYFEDRFVHVDGVWVLETVMPSGRPYEIRAVWESRSLGASEIEGISAESATNLGDGYRALILTDGRK